MLCGMAVSLVIITSLASILGIFAGAGIQYLMKAFSK
jgi:hypothetical protein